MITAMEILPEALGATLELAGEIRPEGLIYELTKLPGWKRVEFLGYIDHDSLPTLLNGVQAGLVVLHPVPQYPEAYPVKMFEYMAASIPIIASDFPLWRQIIQEAGCGLLVDPRDSRAIARAIEYLLTHPTEAALMGKQGRHAVESFYNWEYEERKLLQLYADLLPAFASTAGSHKEAALEEGGQLAR
jgi:glycosyltransferase involved in cell wall biosynthesis